MSRLVGLFNAPYVDLEPHLDAPDFAVLDAEITRGLALVEPGYTGGSLKWMGVVAPWVREDGYVDCGHVLEAMTPDEIAELVALGHTPPGFTPSRAREYRFGDETDNPLTLAQARFLEYRYGVYFPWKVCYHLLENDRWEDKHSGEGKAFSTEARAVFPETVAFLETLPFREIGRAVIFGLHANDHAPAHRDTEPGEALEVAQSVSIDPRGDKRFYLVDAAGGNKTRVNSRLYWFNDMDYHGVDPAPRFQYSVRVDGVFETAFVKRMERASRAGDVKRITLKNV